MVKRDEISREEKRKLGWAERTMLTVLGIIPFSLGVLILVYVPLQSSSSWQDTLLAVVLFLVLSVYGLYGILKFGVGGYDG